jgi:hypothetical protein
MLADVLALAGADANRKAIVELVIGDINAKPV